MENFRFIHSADWHLGHSFLEENERRGEYLAFFESLLKIIQNENAEALIVSGDIFDGVNPSAVAQKLLYDFLNALHQKFPFFTVVLVAGNHDSATRLLAPQSLFEAFNVKVAGAMPLNLEDWVVPFQNQQGETKAFCLTVPFLRLNDVWHLVEEKEGKSSSAIYAEGLKLLYQKLILIAQNKMEGKNLPLIATGHCYVQGGALSLESERRLMIGGEEGLNAQIFPSSLTYVALGHLHKAQQVSNSIFYSGSILPLSFSERHYAHQVRSVLLENGNLKETQAILLPRAVDFLQWPEEGALLKDEILNKINALPFKGTEAQNLPFLKIRLKLERGDANAFVEIRKALENKAVRLVKLEAWAENEEEAPLPNTVEARIPLPKDLFAQLYKARFKEDVPEEWLNAFLSLEEAVLNEGTE